MLWRRLQLILPVTGIILSDNSAVHTSILPLAAIWVAYDSWCTSVRVLPGHLSRRKMTGW